MNTAKDHANALAEFGSVKAGADFNGLQVVKFWFNGRRHEVVIGTPSCERIRACYNGSTEDFERDCVSRIGTVSYENQQAPGEDVVAFLNRWRQASHAERSARMLENPDRYGHMSPDDPDLVPPAILVSAFYVQGKGWNKTMEVDQAKALAGL